MGRPPRLSREAVLAAAAEMDLEDLSLHALAARLGVTHSALYTYFSSKAALVAALVDDRLDGLEIPPRDDLSWQEWLPSAAEALRRLTEQSFHAGDPYLPGVAASHPLIDAIAAAFFEAGLSARDVHAAFVSLSGHCVNAVMLKRRVQRYGPYTRGHVRKSLRDWGIERGTALWRMNDEALPAFSVDQWLHQQVADLIDTLEAKASRSRRANSPVKAK